MAAHVKHAPVYEINGSTAYSPAWTREVHALPQEERLRPRPQVLPKERDKARPRIRARVRECDKVSPFAIVGFLAVGVLAVMLLLCCVELTIVGDEAIQLRSQLSELQEEEAKLLAQYELAYDLQMIEAQMTADGSMSKPSSAQIVILDLSEPDSVVVYGTENPEDTLPHQVKSFFTSFWS